MRTASQRQNVGRTTRAELATEGARTALRLRRELGIALNEAVCVYDTVERLGVEVRFADIPSMEGMYIKRTRDLGRPLILVSSFRPSGRQASTAAHELGHHAFGHGTHIDQYVRGIGMTLPHAPLTDPEEVLANAFGAFLLMPKVAVERGFRERGFEPSSATPRQAFIVAGWLGVGYATLVHHMRSSLRLITPRHADALLTQKPKRIRESLLGRPSTGNVVIVDGAWSGRPVDLQVGDAAILPSGTRVEAGGGRNGAEEMPASLAVFEHDGAVLIEAMLPGIARVACGEWAAFVRTSRRGYVGRNAFRHLEPAGDDEEQIREVDDDVE